MFEKLYQDFSREIVLILFFHFDHTSLRLRITILFLPVYPVINEAKHCFIIYGFSPGMKSVTANVARLSIVKKFCRFFKEIGINLSGSSYRLDIFLAGIKQVKYLYQLFNQFFFIFHPGGLG